MTYIAASLARQLAAKGCSYAEIWQGVQDAGFRITSTEALDVYREYVRASIRDIKVVK